MHVGRSVTSVLYLASAAARLRCSPAPARRLVRMATPGLPYPRAAVSCVLATQQEDGGQSYLLVKRGKPPGVGLWSLPGGKLELGEETLAGALRETFEETGLDETVLTLHPWPITTTDAIYRDDEGGYAFHYCIAQVYASVLPEAVDSVVAGDDALEVRWFTLEEVQALQDDDIAGNVLSVVRISQQLKEANIISN
uniref:Nudix hydrolase domain-containing protein n=1 Tax=Pinguiococcus pyrenoidosus TaxID=172671 RepID=A0A7R9U976_9STRA|mmetsp:Transcript_19938/g.75313  ORF Transcript_19938/g.75313 Transcript_19938/m.75313 type:complete len:196 (+) Transcript_19938:20-607(+)